MKTVCLISVVCTAFTFSMEVSASSVMGDLTPRPGEDGDGINYAFQIYLQGSPETVTGTVGSRAWGEGWTHTAVWGYIDVPTAGTYRLAVSSDASDMVPALTLYQGVDNSGGDNHVFDPLEVPVWVDEPGFAFLEASDQGPGPASGAATVITRFLQAGEYTVVLGGNDFATEGHQVGYSFTVAPVPIPAAVWLFGTGLVGVLGIGAKRRRAVAA